MPGITPVSRQTDRVAPKRETAKQTNTNDLAAGATDFFSQIATGLPMLAGGLMNSPLASMAGFGGLGGLGGLGGGSLQSIMSLMSSNPMGGQVMLLQLQEQMQARSQAFQTISNISKSEHDSKMNAVRNIRP